MAGFLHRPMALPGRVLLVAVLLAAGVAQAGAATPMETVRVFYDRIGIELDPAELGRFVDPALSVMTGAQALRASGEGDCLDPNMPLDNAPPDSAEIQKTLKLVEAVNGDTAKVVVAFVVEGAPHRLEWKLKKVGDDWKVSDLLSVTGEWALSQYGCQ